MAEQADSQMELVIKSTDQKYTVAAEPGSTVAEVKALVAEKSGIPVDRQRLIYGGRVLKDTETVASYKIKAGQTVHLVRSAALPSTSAAAATSGNASNTPAAPAAPQVPVNLAAGQGTGNMLADLTGARYAGLAQLPSASMFGPDGGMGPAPSQEDVLSMMETPGFRESMQQALQNPQMVDLMINSNPQLRQMGPQFRQMLQSEEIRNMLSNPQLMRQMLQLERAMGGGAAGLRPNSNAFPAPGSVTDGATAGDGSADSTAAAGTTAPAANPFAALLNQGAGGAAGAGAAANPFAALLNPPADGAQNPMFNPALLAGLWGNQGAAAPAEPEDTRPPEERYESELRQLNDVGFFDFDRNVRALRRSGGNVQAAINALLDGSV